MIARWIYDRGKCARGLGRGLRGLTYLVGCGEWGREQGRVVGGVRSGGKVGWVVGVLKDGGFVVTGGD